MYPDEVAWLEDFRYACCEGSVGVSVGVPVGGGGCGDVGCDVLPEEVVEQRPEGYTKTEGWLVGENRRGC